VERSIWRRAMSNECTAARSKNEPVPGRVVINRKQLLQKVPLSERAILDMEKRGDFPRRFSISTRVVVWDVAEVDAWIARQQAAAIQPQPPGARGRSQ